MDKALTAIFINNEQLRWASATQRILEPRHVMVVHKPGAAWLFGEKENLPAVLWRMHALRYRKGKPVVLPAKERHEHEL